MVKKSSICFVGLLFLLWVRLSFVSALPIYVKPLGPDGSLNPSTSFNYTFNFTSSSDCALVVLNKNYTITTGKDGIGFVDIDTSGINKIPTHLCEYRDGSLRKIHSLPDSFAKNIFANSINVSNNVSADWIYARINHSYIQNQPSYLINYTETDPMVNETFNQSLTDSLYAEVRWGYNHTNLSNQYTDSVNQSLSSWINLVFLKISDMFTKNEIVSMIQGNKTSLANVSFINQSNTFSGNITAPFVFTNGSYITDVCLSNGSNCKTSGVNPFDQVLNSTSNVVFNSVNSTIFNGKFNFTSSAPYLNFDGAVLNLNETRLNLTIDNRLPTNKPEPNLICNNTLVTGNNTDVQYVYFKVFYSNGTEYKHEVDFNCDGASSHEGLSLTTGYFYLIDGGNGWRKWQISGVITTTTFSTDSNGNLTIQVPGASPVTYQVRCNIGGYSCNSPFLYNTGGPP